MKLTNATLFYDDVCVVCVGMMVMRKKAKVKGGYLVSGLCVAFSDDNCVCGFSSGSERRGCRTFQRNVL